MTYRVQRRKHEVRLEYEDTSDVHGWHIAGAGAFSADHAEWLAKKLTKAAEAARSDEKWETVR